MADVQTETREAVIRKVQKLLDLLESQDLIVTAAYLTNFPLEWRIDIMVTRTDTTRHLMILPMM